MHSCWLLCYRGEYAHPCSFLWERSAAVEWSLTFRASALSSLFVSSFQRLDTSVSDVDCSCYWLCQFFSNVTMRAGLGVASLSKSTRSPFCEVTRSMQSPGIVAWVMIANDFVCKNSNPWSCALDNRTQSTAKVLSVELCNHHEILLPPGHFQMDSLVLERLPNGLYRSPFFPESIHFTIWTASSMKVLHEICNFSNLEALIHNASFLARLEYHQSALE